ncbi:MAG: glutathione S-transferase N-terminal domain-containing protein, partial [Burkholderiaceae bacterium]
MHESSFRQWISAAPGARFAPEPDRYHLYVMRGCPWAHRTLIARKLKGLEEVIGMTAVHQHLVEGVGWTFSPDRPDPLYGAARLRELYEMASPGYDGRVTVPTLWDIETGRVVNNESADIIRMLNSEFDGVGGDPAV